MRNIEIIRKSAPREVEFVLPAQANFKRSKTFKTSVYEEKSDILKTRIITTNCKRIVEDITGQEDIIK